MAIIRYKLDPNDLRGPSPESQARIDALTPEQIEENARTDPDNPPSTDEELARGAFGRAVRLTRENLGLSQSEFARAFHINLRRLQDWEQGRVSPDSVTLAYLKLIQREAGMVRRVLETAP
ncbi:MAG: helix-turn-helix domain-containing protein [Pseudomonadota bacterium]|nr:helix-turn-helix domain-containing protein [Pseudomonadota bacterium]